MCADTMYCFIYLVIHHTLRKKLVKEARGKGKKKEKEKNQNVGKKPGSSSLAPKKKGYKKKKERSGTKTTDDPYRMGPTKFSFFETPSRVNLGGRHDEKKSDYLQGKDRELDLNQIPDSKYRCHGN